MFWKILMFAAYVLFLTCLFVKLAIKFGALDPKNEQSEEKQTKGNNANMLKKIISVGVGLIVVAAIIKAFPAVGVALTALLVSLIGAAVIYGILKLVKWMSRKIEGKTVSAPEQLEKSSESDKPETYTEGKTVSASEQLEKSSESDKSETYTFVLTGNIDAETQKKLHDLKLRITADGLTDTVHIVDDDGNGVSVSVGDTFLGVAQSADAAWIHDNLDKLKRVDDLFIYGGGTTLEGNPIPFVVKLWVKVPAGTNAPKLSEVYLPKPKYDGYYAKSGQVVYVLNKKIHLGFSDNCDIDLNACTPMLYEEALDAGCVECSKCFE